MKAVSTLRLNLLRFFYLVLVIGIGLGLRYPLQMLPVLFWEFTWKASWLLAVALPHWLRGQWSQYLGANTFAIGMIVIFIPLVPWSYVFEHYVRKSGDRWRGHALVSPDKALSKG